MVFVYVHEQSLHDWHDDCPKTLNNMLLAAGRVCKAFQPLLDDLLYRIVRFHTCKAFTVFCHAVQCSQSRRLAVRSLSLCFRGGIQSIVRATKKTLPPLSNLIELTLTNGTDDLIALIPEMRLTGLRVLRLCPSHIYDNHAMKTVAVLPSLEELEIFGNYDNLELGPTDVLPNLKLLHLRYHYHSGVKLRNASSPLTHLCLGIHQTLAIQDAVRLFGPSLVSFRVVQTVPQVGAMHSLWPTCIMMAGPMPLLRRLELEEVGLPAVRSPMLAALTKY